MTVRAVRLDGPAGQAPDADVSDANAAQSDPDALWRALRQRIAAARREARADDTPPSDGDGMAATQIAHASEIAEAGATVPAFANLSLPRRLFARFTARLLIYFLRVITIDQQQFNRLVVAALRQLVGDTGALRRRFDAIALQLESAHAERDAVLARVSGLADALAAERERISSMADTLAADREQVSRMADTLAAEHEQVRAQTAALAELRDTNELLLMQIQAVKRQPPRPRDADATAEPAAPAGDADVTPVPAVDRRLLVDAFRGSESSVTDRQRRYLSYFDGCTNVLDVGCGRGEFLQLLRQAGIGAQGVDLDDDLARWCRERGLVVRGMDALEYLAELRDGELDGIFCAQVVEHLRTADLLRFVDLAYQKLRPGGRIVIETLNPESLLVLYRWFWMDLTHERLVHPDTLMFLLRSKGFGDVDCDFVPPPPGPLHIPPLHFAADPPAQLQEFNAATQHLNRLLYSSFDYAVMAVR